MEIKQFNDDYYQRICNLNDFEILAGKKYNYIGQLFVNNISMVYNFENQIKDLINKLSQDYNWGTHRFKVMYDKRSDNRTTFGFLTFSVNRVHLDVIRRLDNFCFKGKMIRVRANGFTNDSINWNVDINYEFQRREITIFNEYFGENVKTIVPICALQLSANTTDIIPFDDENWDDDLNTTSQINDLKRSISNVSISRSNVKKKRKSTTSLSQITTVDIYNEINEDRTSNVIVIDHEYSYTTGDNEATTSKDCNRDVCEILSEEYIYFLKNQYGGIKGLINKLLEDKD
jgi:hypothetical protein